MRSLPPINEYPSQHHILSMNIIFWNCKRALDPSFYQSVDNIIRAYSPSIMVITETRVGGTRAKEIIDRLPFDGAAHADTMGYARGIWLLYLLMQWTSSSFPPLNRRFTLLLRYANLPFLGLFLPYMLARDLENDVYFGKISMKLSFSIVYLGLFWKILMKVSPVRIS